MESGIEQPTDQHLQFVWMQIEAMNSGDVLIVKEQSKKFPQRWVKCACMYMDCFGYGIIEFNQDYTVLRKISRI
jgi:hypothetical protein